MRRTLLFCMKAVVLLALFAAGASAEPALAATFTVTNVNDSGPGSLRQAIQDAIDLGVSFSVINFSIGTGVKTISPLSPLPTITIPMTIDGTTQPGYAGKPIIEIEGSHAGAANGLLISGGFSTIRGLVINRFSGVGISMFDTNGNIIEDNYIGTDVTGSIDLGNAGGGVFNSVGTAAHVIRRNVISGNGGNGISLSVGGLSFVEDNYIGTDATGSFALGNDLNGIRGSFETMNVRRNVVSGNHQNGILSGGINVFQGNLIGTDATGKLPIGNAGHGLQGVDDQVGGLNPGEGNIIAFNGGSGVVELADLNLTAILSNSIFSNGGLGIDINGDGVTPNDACEADPALTAAQNYPILTSAIRAGTNTVIGGTLDSKPNSTFLIQFFANADCDPSGFGEGQHLIGSITVTSGASCVTSFTATFPNTSVAGGFITATASRSGVLGYVTSEFSQCLAVTNPNPQQGIQILLSNIASLVAQGVLNQGEGNALSSKLEAALKQLERGNVRPAANQINAFIHQVEAMIRSRRLSPQQGQALIDMAMGVLGGLGAPSSSISKDSLT